MEAQDPFLKYRLGPYLIEQNIGKGMYGIVYRAIHTTLHTNHAVKIYTAEKIQECPNLMGYILNQISLLENKHHPNLANLEYYKEIPDKGFFLVMEYCNSGNLKEKIKKETKIDEKTALEILQQLVNGFKFLYNLGLMHRDFKSRNVLLHQEPSGKMRYKIADFDFVRLGNGNTYVGTIHYMAPEVLMNGPSEANDRAYENKIDVWSLGVVFYEMLHGSLPFNGKTDVHQIKEIKRLVGTVTEDKNGISEESRDFLRKTLVLDKLSRIGWEDIFEHPATKRKVSICTPKEVIDVKKKIETKELGIEEDGWICVQEEIAADEQLKDRNMRRERKWWEWWQFLCGREKDY